MGKRVQITPKIEELIKANAGEDVNVNDLAVFETESVNTKPVLKPGSLFDGATVTPNTLIQMAKFNDEGGYVPLHTLHQQGEELPVGRVFYSEVTQDFDGSSGLRSLFYLPLSETDLISKVDSGVINEVSVGLKTNQILCSECGWDYLGADATFMNLWDRTCANEHTIGTDGIHAVLSGMDRWMELSLVSKGAARGASIMGRAKQVLGQETYDKLAASGVVPETTLFFHTYAGSEAMDMKELIADLTSVKASAQIAEGKVTELTTSVAALTTERDELKAKAAEVAPVAAKLAETETALTASQTELEASKKKIEELEASIVARDALQASGVPAGGAANAAISDASKPVVSGRAAAFKTR